MTSYVTTVGIKIAGEIVPPRTRLDPGDRRLDALGVKETKRLIAQGYLNPLGIARNTEPGAPLLQHPPLPTTAKSNVEGTKIRQVEYGDPDKGGRVVNLELPMRVAPVDRSPASRPAPPAPRKARKNKTAELGQPNGKWDLDPERVAEIDDIETLNALVHDIDPRVDEFAEGQEQAARDLLTKDHREPAPVEGALRVEGDIDVEGKDKGRRSTKRTASPRSGARVRKGT